VSRVVSAAVDEAPVRRRDGVELGGLWEELVAHYGIEHAFGRLSG
jgi:hypothetical protein